MTIHELKTWPEFFEHVLSGDKTFEVRLDDRGFRAGDVLLLREFQPKSKRYTGREVRRTVTYLLAGPAFGVAAGHVVMALSAEPTREQEENARLKAENARLLGEIRAEVTRINGLDCPDCGHGLAKSGDKEARKDECDCCGEARQLRDRWAALAAAKEPR